MAERTLPGLGLTGFWDLGADGWKDANDVNLRLLSALVQPRALDHVGTTPGSPTDGDIYLFTAAHATQPNKIAIRDDGAWVHVTPASGWLVYDVAAGFYRKFSGSAWIEFAGYTDEQARDAIGAALIEGTGIDITVNDGGDTITITNTAPSSGSYTDEQARDAIGTALASSGAINIAVNDGSDTITISQGAVTSQAGTSYTAVLGDANTYIRFSNASAVSFTIPPNSSAAFPVGTVIEVEQAGAGALSFVAGSGVTLNSRSSDLTLAGQYAVAFAKKVATDTWTVNGDL